MILRKNAPAVMDAQPFQPSKAALLAVVLALQPLVWLLAFPVAVYAFRLAFSRRATLHVSRRLHLLSHVWFVDAIFACSILAVGLGVVGFWTAQRRIPKGRSRELSLCCAMLAIFLGVFTAFLIFLSWVVRG